MRTRIVLALLLPLLSTALTACGGGGASLASEAADAGPIEECEAFLKAYERCLDALGPERIAQARVAQTRSALAAQSSGGEAARATLRAQCAANLAQTKSSCQ